MKLVAVSKDFVSVSSIPIKVASFIRYEVKTDLRYHENSAWVVHISALQSVVDYGVKICNLEVDGRALPARLKSMLSLGEVKGQDAYSVLHLRPTAPVTVVKAAYKALCLETHPDQGGDAELFLEVDKAYKEVMSERSRKD